jgi:hypothetical protein
VERAQSAEASAGALQAHILADEFHDIRSRSDFFLGVIAVHTSSISSCRLRV